MDNTKKIQKALKLYPFYEAVSGDLLFFSVIQTIFLTLVKGFSAEQVATVILISDFLALALEYPSYKLIQCWGNSRSIIVGGILPLFGITLITLGQNLTVIAIGTACAGIAYNFQSMASAGARNNMVLLGEKEQFAKLFSRGNLIYSAISMVATILIPFLFSINRYTPSVLCAVVCAVAAVISFFIPDYTEQGGGESLAKKQKEQQMQKDRNVKIGGSFRLLAIVFCLFFCAGAVFRSNTELFLSEHLQQIFSEQETIYIYGAILWGTRFFQFSSNACISVILDFLKEKIVIVAPFVMLLAFLIIGGSGLFFGKSIVPVCLAGLFYIAIRGIFWDPLRTFLRMLVTDTNSKKRQQTMLMILNIGQSVVSIAMDLIVVSTLKIYSLEYVFLAFSVILTIELIFAAQLHAKIASQIELMQYHSALNEEEVDRISELVYACLVDAGYDKREALQNRLLVEEKLIACLNNDMRDAPVDISVTRKLDDACINLTIRDKKIEIFRMPEESDSLSNIIFSNIVKHM